jgi:hypothetical protein
VSKAKETYVAPITITGKDEDTIRDKRKKLMHYVQIALYLDHHIPSEDLHKKEKIPAASTDYKKMKQNLKAFTKNNQKAGKAIAIRKLKAIFAELRTPNKGNAN